MTNYSSSESQRLFPHTGLATSSFSRNASHSIQRSQQQHTPNEARSSHDNTTTGPSFLPRLETPVKRQKLDGGNPSSISASETPPHDIKASVFLGQIGRPLINKSRELSDLTQAGTLVSKEQHQIAPFPARPGNLSGKNVTIDEKLLADAPREPVQARPYAFEVPRIAPIYQNGNPADFFPWKGNHPEDILNENSTKSGYFDKLQVSQNGEMSSARLSIWASVKHKSGLQILSSLFVSALDQRQAHGTINSKSTFKPPPRVTLTDTKREAWLKDLGDPNMPLRRLSRTIPHGIRGKALLDHCLAKNIPTWRAVWLAKCVGANEIRAFKRKGTGGAFVSGGESKWIKDWTANVEQFVDALIAACGTTGWKGQMTYGLQLVAHIYSDYLVDQEHFLDWIITSTQEAENDTLPIWLLIVQMYWKDIPLYRRRGRRLAIALSEQLYRISSQGTVDANATLWRKISSLIRALMLSRPACFLFLDRWPRYAVPLNDCIASEDSATMACFEKISLRNRRFAEKVERDRAGNILTPRQQLILLLDGTKSTFNISHLSDTCLETVGDRELLVSTTIRWATTRFRSRVNGIYLSTRLLRRWNKSGVDLDSPLLNFLGICSSEIGLDSSKICKLVSELLRSRHFSIGRYLQWLVARGLTMGSVKQVRSYAYQFYVFL